MDKDKRKKSVKDSMKSREASIKRSVASSKYIANEIKAAAAGKEFKAQQGLSKKQFEAALKKEFDKAIKRLEKLKAIEHSKFYKGKPHLKHGGKAKKKYGVIGKPTLKKGGKA